MIYTEVFITALFFFFCVVERKQRFLLNLGFLNCYLFAGKSIHGVGEEEEEQQNKKHDTLARMDEIEGCFLCDCMHNGVSLGFCFIRRSSCREETARSHNRIIFANALGDGFQIGHLSSSPVSTASSSCLCVYDETMKEICLTLNWLSLEWNQWRRCAYV